MLGSCVRLPAGTAVLPVARAVCSAVSETPQPASLFGVDQDLDLLRLAADDRHLGDARDLLQLRAERVIGE